jgi:hypothetical protein
MADGLIVEVRGLAELKAKLRRLGDVALIHEALLRVGRWAEATLKGRPYPSERTGQKYQRTGRLNRAWLSRMKGKQISVINPANFRGQYYAIWVVGDTQAWPHEGRWWTAREVIEGVMPKALEETGQWAESIWNG